MGNPDAIVSSQAEMSGLASAGFMNKIANVFGVAMIACTMTTTPVNRSISDVSDL